MWEGFEVSEALCCCCFPRCLGVGSIILVTPTAAKHERTGPFRTAEDIFAAL